MSTAGAQAGAAGQAPLDAVLRAPDDDKPRLDYAAWCDVQPGLAIKARGVFVRTQITMLRRGATMEWREKDRHIEVMAAAQRDHGSQWDAGVRAWVAEARYERGMIELVTVSAAAWRDHGADIRRAAPVRHLDLTGVVEAGAAFLASDALAGIRSIRMDYEKLTDEYVEALAASAHVGDLRWLSMEHNELTEASGRALAASDRMPLLRYVAMRGNPYDPTNRFTDDGDYVGSVWMPPEGERLERRFGKRFAWLRWAGETTATARPDRFTV